MATQGDVRRIALSMAGAEEATDRFAFSVLVRLDAVSIDDLEVLIAEAWRCAMPAKPASRRKSSG